MISVRIHESPVWARAKRFAAIASLAAIMGAIVVCFAAWLAWVRLKHVFERVGFCLARNLGRLAAFYPARLVPSYPMCGG